MAEVSIVIPNFNRGRYLTACIESVLAQSFAKREIIVIDDGSSDFSREVLYRYHDKITLIEQEHCGAAAARNAGIAAAGGDYIAFLNSDDLINPNRIELQYKALRSNPEAGLVFCDLNFIDAEDNPIGDVYSHDDFSQETFYASMLERNYIGSCSAVMVRQSVLEQTGLFDEDLDRKEEYDLWLRILSIADAEYVPQPLVTVRVGTGRTLYGRDTLSGAYHKALRRFPLVEIKRALARKYEHPFQIQLAYARILLKIDQHAQLLHILGELLELQPRNFEARFLQGCYYLKVKNYSSAMDHLETCREIDPDVPEVLNNIGICHAIMGNNRDARKMFERAARLRHEYFDPRFNLATLKGESSSFALRPTLDRLRPKFFPAPPELRIEPE